jgi:hypothetical protein
MKQRISTSVHKINRTTVIVVETFVEPNVNGFLTKSEEKTVVHFETSVDISAFWLDMHFRGRQEEVFLINVE